MMKSKWFWGYVGVTSFFGYVTGGGITGALSVMLVGVGAIVDAIVTPHGQPHNIALIWGASLVFWIGVYCWFKFRAAPAIAAPAPRETSLERSRTYEIIEGD